MNLSAENPRAALTTFVSELGGEYEVWYAKSVRRTYRTWAGLQLLALLSGFGTALLTALVDAASFDSLKPWMIVLPLVGSLAATLLLQFRIYELWSLREQGRQAFQRLALEGRLRLAQAKTEEECSATHKDLMERSSDIEEDQSKRFFGFWKGSHAAAFVPTSKETNRPPT